MNKQKTLVTLNNSSCKELSPTVRKMSSHPIYVSPADINNVRPRFVGNTPLELTRRETRTKTITWTRDSITRRQALLIVGSVPDGGELAELICWSFAYIYEHENLLHLIRETESAKDLCKYLGGENYDAHVLVKPLIVKFHTYNLMMQNFFSVWDDTFAMVKNGPREATLEHIETLRRRFA